ncbi:3 exoribonuclease domain 1 domain-containing protein [Cystoisospora suis]|uniref:3 exoribonuclease domain 1 domain-containing protein n=1 Tax=Cystoisospora suis TaxID=483139 RepID=A0A2C6L851_9APIC|nr:3 exoribonuclease domain 1 domain-containing protein [Cystoisospora suis]
MLPLCGTNANAVVEALTAGGLRVDGRGPLDYRRVRVSFRRSNGNAEVLLGRTRCLCQVTAAPFALLPTDRASDGELSFRVSLASSVAAAVAEAAVQTSLASTLAAAEGSSRRSMRSLEIEKEIERLLWRLLKDSGVVDTEALSIQSGRWAWHVKVSITVLDDDGNLRDSCLLAALCGLMHFRKEAVTVDGDHVVLHSVADREPLPLCIHHLPVLVSFAFLRHDTSSIKPARHSEGQHGLEENHEESQGGHIGSGEDPAEELQFVVDPSAIEEASLPGKISIALGQQGEICGVYKTGGPALEFRHIRQLIKLAEAKAKELLSIVQAAVQQDQEARKRLMRTNARSRYEAPCVSVSLPEPYTILRSVVASKESSGLPPAPAQLPACGLSSPVVPLPCPPPPQILLQSAPAALTSDGDCGSLPLHAGAGERHGSAAPSPAVLSSKAGDTARVHTAGGHEVMEEATLNAAENPKVLGRNQEAVQEEGLVEGTVEEDCDLLSAVVPVSGQKKNKKMRKSR